MFLLLASIPLMLLAVALATVPIVVAMRREHAEQRGATAPADRPVAWRPATDDVPAAA